MEGKNNKAIRLIQLNQYIRPKLDENKSKNWVLNGKNNEFYDYIINRYNGSPTNSAIINSVIDLFYGNGLDYKNKANTSDWIKLKKILNHKELKKLISDFVIFNECAFQVGKNKTKKDINYIYHLPKNKVVPSLENEDEEIEGYWYCRNWKEQTKFPPEYFNSFGTTNDAIEIYNLKPYKAGKEYFADPDYLAGLPYCEMEEEIANYYVSHIKNGLSFGYIINVPNGDQLSEPEQAEFERQIKRKLTGSSNAGKFILSFNGIDAEITIVPLEVNDAHKQWEYLTGEARQQILTAHRVVSPMLVGIKDNTGFGNNAEELDRAEAQWVKRVIQPKQRVFLDALKDILEAYNINLDLYFKPLTETTTNDVSLSSDEKKNLDTTVADELIAKGEVLGDEWELVESVVIESEADLHFKTTNTGVARPNAKSELDGDKFKSRLRYSGEISANSREFCKKMINSNKLYRIEDINMMSNKVVNEGFGAGGSNIYDILLYKGGARCRHYWTRETYRLKADVNSPLAEEITPAKARKEGEILPKLDKKVYQKPNDMANNGFIS